MTKKSLTTREKRRVAERAGNCCEYCRTPARFAPDPLAIEHIRPRSRRGQTTLRNVALCCQGCNNHKYNKTEGYDPVSGQIVPLFHPRRHQWRDHFTWAEEFTRIIGLTLTGRATIDALCLNREGLVNLRAVLYAAGEHPPREPGEDR